MKLITLVFLLFFACSLPGLAEAEPSSIPSKKMPAKEAKEVAKMEKRLALAIEKKDIAELEKILAPEYFDVYEGDKRAMSKLEAIARCKAGLLKYLAIQKEQKVSSQDDVIAVEGLAKLIPNRQEDTVPPEQWVHVRRSWTKKDGKWLLKSQIRHIEGDEGEVD